MTWFKKKTAVGVFCRQGRLLILPRHRTTAGVYIAGEPVFTAPFDIASKDLGTLVLSSLKETKDGVPHPEPEEWRFVGQPLWKAAGVRSWANFVKGTKSCEIYREGSTLQVVPTHNMGVKGGFNPINEAVQILSIYSSPDTLGDAIRKAMEFAASQQP